MQILALKRNWGGAARDSNTLDSTQKPFILAQSLEVAEHLDSKYAQNFINLLTSLSDIILFSAAIPYQGGTHHINEQPPLYWANLFAKNDFVCFDILRSRFWDNPNINSWYRQNILIYTHKSKIDIFRDFQITPNPQYLIIPEIWEWRSKAHIQMETHYNKIFCIKIRRFIGRILRALKLRK